jgi:arylsulfatase A-like enzyme
LLDGLFAQASTRTPFCAPNIDSIARDGGLFTDWHPQPSCTAGREAFINGQPRSEPG